MKNILFKLTAIVLLTTNIVADTCYEKDRATVFNLFEKAFKVNGETIKNLHWLSEQTNVYGGGYSIMMTFDGKEKRGSVWFDKNCNPTNLSISSGFGTVTMYYYDVQGSDLKLKKTRQNTYH